MLDQSAAATSLTVSITGQTHSAIPHESAHKHVSGRANFVDDYPPTRDQLFA